MSRIFNVRLNLDALAADLVHCETDQERGQWLAGFQTGACGALSRQDWSALKARGFAFGVAVRAEASGFIAQQAEHGNKSAEARRQKYGSAKPGRATPEPPSPQPPKVVGTTPEPIHNPQSTIQRSTSENPAATNRPPAPPHPCDGMDGDETPIELAKPIPRESMKINFRDWNMSHPRLWVSRNGEQGSLADWTALFDKFSEEGTEAMDETYSSLIETMEAKKKINYSTFIESLNENYEVTP